MRRSSPLTCLAFFTALTACSKPEAPAPASEPSLPPSAAVVARTDAVCEGTAKLHQRVGTFLEQPSAESLMLAQASWTEAHNAYRLLQSDYQVAGLPLPQWVDERDPIDAWPMLPGYLDSVPGYPHSGLVFSEVPLTPDFLAQEHQSTDFAYLTRGFHPLQFMLWGNEDDDAASQSQKFVRQGAAEEAIDATGRRQDLTRLISNTLKRDSQTFCTDGERRRLSSALEETGADQERVDDPVEVGHEKAARPQDDDPAAQPPEATSEETGQ